MDDTIDYPLLYTNKVNDILKILCGLRQCDVNHVLDLVSIKLPSVAIIQFPQG